MEDIYRVEKVEFQILLRERKRIGDSRETKWNSMSNTKVEHELHFVIGFSEKLTGRQRERREMIIWTKSLVASVCV